MVITGQKKTLGRYDPRFNFAKDRSAYIETSCTVIINSDFLSPLAPLKGSCWFCLGSPQVEKHLVVSVGDDVSGVISL